MRLPGDSTESGCGCRARLELPPACAGRHGEEEGARREGNAVARLFKEGMAYHGPCDGGDPSYLA